MTIVSLSGGAYGLGWVQGLPFGIAAHAVSSPYGPRPLTPELIAVGATMPFHYGTDFAAEVGTPLYACKDGTIDFVQASTGWGNVIRVRHADGSAAMYCHLQSPPPRNVGTAVNRGDCLGLADTTGAASGSHLHFELFKPGYQTLYINEHDTLDAMSPDGQALWVEATDRYGQLPAFSGSPPLPGIYGALVATVAVTPEEMCINLLAFGCNVQALSVLDNNTSQWSTYIPGAPAAVNASAPASIASGSPFMVRAR